MVAALEVSSSLGTTRFAWVIVALPLVSFFLITFFGKRMPAKGAEIGITAMAASFVLSLFVLSHFIQGKPPTEKTLTWFTIGHLEVGVGQFVDGLTAIMLTLVTLVSLCVQVYSIGYMKGDVRYTWFYAVLSLFTGAMLNVVIASDLFQLLVGWEVMGVSSYLLIGHWWEERTNSNAAIKAFITTRVGDIPFMFGIFTLIFATGTSNILKVTEEAGAGRISVALLSAAALLLFGGAIGKSAQFPLHVWLPDAMAGPTPVSALIHAATMVAAGVYLVGRLFSVFVNAAPGALTFVAVIGSITMLLAATLALVQDDIKRVLAYSTVSQLAYMMAALGLGRDGFTAGLFHLYTHGFFKALLFLGAGSVIHAVHSNNMSEMGGLRKYLPITFWTFLIGTIALSGVPPFSGFFSKDEILAVAFHHHDYVIYAVMLLTAILTAFYMARAVTLTFLGSYRGQAHPHESPPVMTVPLVVLATLSVATGLLNAPQFAGGLVEKWVFFEEVERITFDYPLAAISVVVAFGGLVVGYLLYRTWRERDPLTALGPVYSLWEHKYYIDDLYMNGIVRPIRGPLARGVYWTNQHILDGVVNAAGWLARKAGVGVRSFDENVVDGAVNGVGELTGFFGGILRLLQSGNVQTYAALLFAGVVALVIGITRSWVASLVLIVLIAIGILVTTLRTSRTRERPV
jgi:NADH-quinone oxidoreductase subunit L